MNAIVNVPHYAVSDMERIARAFAASKLFGVQNADQALALCLVAQAEGRHPASAAQDYHIIQGRPAKKADAMLRDFLSSGGKVEWHTLTDEQADATFSHPSGGSARIDWTFKRAQTAGISNPMWKKYPRQMLRSRVVSEGVRTVCPGATSGMYVPEEVQDFAQDAPQQQLRDVTPPSEPMAGEVHTIPQRKSAAQAKRDGDNERLRAIIFGFTNVEELDAWAADFDTHTADLPKSWLDSINDVYLAHRNDLIEADEADFPGDRKAVVAGGDRHLEAAH